MDNTPTQLRVGGRLRDKLIADAELVSRVAIVAGLAGLVLPDNVFDIPADLASLKIAAGITGRALLHQVGLLLSKT